MGRQAPVSFLYDALSAGRTTYTHVRPSRLRGLQTRELPTNHNLRVVRMFYVLLDPFPWVACRT